MPRNEVQIDDMRANFQAIAKNLQAPHIDFRSILLPGDKEFWSGVLWAAAVGLQETAGLLGVAETKVWGIQCMKVYMIKYT